MKSIAANSANRSSISPPPAKLLNWCAPLKRQFNQPNVLVRVSNDVVAGGIDDNLNEKTPIEDVILGTQISGTGDTTGRVTSTLVPSRNNAKIQLELKGRTLARTVGWNGPVTIFSPQQHFALWAQAIDHRRRQFRRRTRLRPVLHQQLHRLSRHLRRPFSSSASPPVASTAAKAPPKPFRPSTPKAAWKTAWIPAPAI